MICDGELYMDIHFGFGTASTTVLSVNWPPGVDTVGFKKKKFLFFNFSIHVLTLYFEAFFE